MASNHFGEKLKRAVETDVDRLLGRLLTAYPVPLNDLEFVRMWTGSFPPNIQSAYECLRRENIYVSVSHRQEVMVTSNSALVYLRIRLQEREMLTPSTSPGRNVVVWRGRRWYALATDTLRAACDAGRWEAFEEWLFNRAQLEVEFVEAFETISQILDMASTIGQLKRMMPDLQTYLSDEHKALLRSQQRASSLPYEFAAFDHDKLHRAVAVMAKCHLMNDEPRIRWGDRDGYTGAIVATD